MQMAAGCQVYQLSHFKQESTPLGSRSKTFALPIACVPCYILVHKITFVVERNLIYSVPPWLDKTGST